MKQKQKRRKASRGVEPSSVNNSPPGGSRPLLTMAQSNTACSGCGVGGGLNGQVTHPAPLTQTVGRLSPERKFVLIKESLVWFGKNVTHIGKFFVSKTADVAFKELTYLPLAFNPTFRHVRPVSPRMASYLRVRAAQQSVQLTAAGVDSAGDGNDSGVN